MPLLNHRILLLISFTAISLSLSVQAQKNKTVQEVVGIVSTYCGACHAVPSPALMPKKDWPYVIKRMAELAAEKAGREFINEEYLRDITAYYYGSSPAELTVLPHTPNPAAKTPIIFKTTSVGNTSAFPLITHINQVNLFDKKGKEFLLCDAESNQVIYLEQKGRKWKEKVLAEIKLPAHTEVLDFDNDGDNDIIVSSLGRFFAPVDFGIGKVVLLRQIKKGKFKKEILLENIPRILEARAHDVDGDGDFDLTLAIFGNNDVGEVAWLENQGQEKFVKHTLLNLAGGISIKPADMNNDGKTDLVTLISQEYEMVVVMLNKGKGQYENIVVFKGGQPMLGSTSLEISDLDQDGDQDLILTNGDAHDLQTDPKPYHGVQWLQNLGELKFQTHDIGRFYGAVNAKVADMDNDGDKDIIASSWNNLWRDPKRQTMVWFENDGKQIFKRHNILSRPHSIVSFELADLNQDKRPDIIAGIFKIDLLKNKVEVEKEGLTPEATEDFDFKSKKQRIVFIKNKKT